MRDDFAVFILTHGRADNVVTLRTLKRQGYTGRWYMVIDDEDDMAPVYRKNFGEDHVIQFCKRNAVDRADTMDNFDEHRAILYARNESFRIAQELGLKYFLMLDDDYSGFMLRFPDGDKLGNQILIGEDLEAMFKAMLGLLDSSGALTVAFAQGGDYIGGGERRSLRKAPHAKGHEYVLLQDRPPDRVPGNHERGCYGLHHPW